MMELGVLFIHLVPLTEYCVPRHAVPSLFPHVWKLKMKNPLGQKILYLEAKTFDRWTDKHQRKSK